MKNYVILSLLLTNALNGAALYNQEKELTMLEITCCDGTESQENFATQMGISPADIHRIGTTLDKNSTDFWQSNCMQKLEDSLKNYENKYIVSANSQYTAIALNFFSRNPAAARKCKGMVLKSVLASGNSLIYHSITNSCPLLKKIPFLYYVTSHLPKIVYPSYSPEGDQPIKLVEELKIDAPIIIVHSKKDLELLDDDACAIYYKLRENKRLAYLIDTDKIESVSENSENSENSEEKTEFISRTVKEILEYHLSEQQREGESGFSQYQPDHNNYKHHYVRLIEKDNIVAKYGLWPLALAITGSAPILGWFLNKMSKPLLLAAVAILLKIVHIAQPS